MPDPSLADPRDTPDRAPLPTTDLGSTGTDLSRPDLESTRPAIPGYEVFEELGKGGMGVVYRGRQVAADRVVALKMILGGGALDEHALNRFRTEAQAVARLQHPNIVQVFEVGEHQGLPFFSLEYCDGGSLAKNLAGTPLRPAEAAALVETLARAVQAAHDKGVIHRDLKPANVLLSRGTGGPPVSESQAGRLCHEPKIADFGLAKKLDDDAGETVAGAIMGTPSYMAPEQARGEAVGPAADVYALGAILYECLVGRPPFRAATKYDTIQQVIHADPVAPRALQPTVPRDLETVCLKCLHKEADRRYVSAAALADDLRRFRDGEPIVARPVGAAERVVKWARRRRTTAALLVVLLLVGLLSLGGAAAFTYYLNEARVDALDQKGIAEEEREKTKDALRESRIVAANLALERGQTLGDAGNAAAALHWFVRGLELAPEDEYPLREVLLANLAAWSGQVHSLHARMDYGIPVPVNAAAVSADGRTILTCSHSLTKVHVWDAETGRQLGEAIDHPDYLYAIAISPDGKTLLTGCRDGKARLWSLKTRAEIGRPFVHTNSVMAVAFRPDGQAIATASVGRDVRLWDLATGNAIGTPLLHDSEVGQVVFQPGGQLLLTTSNDGKIHRWDARTGKQVGSPLSHTNSIRAVDWLPSGKTALVSDTHFSTRELDVASWKFAGDRLFSPRLVSALAIGPGGQAAVGATGDVQLWDVEKRTSVGPSIQHDGECLVVAFVPGGKRLLTACNNGTAELWNLSSTRPTIAKPRFGAASFASSRQSDIRPDGRAVAVGSFRGHVQTFETATGNPLGSARQIGSSVVNLRYSPDGTKILVCGMTKTARLYDAATWDPAGPPLIHQHIVMAVGFAANGRLLLTAANKGGVHAWEEKTGIYDGVARVWDAASGKQIGQGLAHDDKPIMTIAGSPDGKHVLAGGGGGAWLFNIETGKELHVLPHPAHVQRVTFNLDGKLMATSSEDGVVRMWDVATGRLAATPFRHNGVALGMRFSLDGRFLLTGSMDTTARIWDVATGRRVGPLFQHSSAVVSSPTISTEGNTIVTNTANGDIYTWKMRTHLPDQPRRLALWAQLLTAKQLDKAGGLHTLSDADWRQRREQLAALGGPPLP